MKRIRLPKNTRDIEVLSLYKDYLHRYWYYLNKDNIHIVHVFDTSVWKRFWYSILKYPAIYMIANRAVVPEYGFKIYIQYHSQDGVYGQVIDFEDYRIIGTFFPHDNTKFLIELYYKKKKIFSYREGIIKLKKYPLHKISLILLLLLVYPKLTLIDPHSVYSGFSKELSIDIYKAMLNYIPMSGAYTGIALRRSDIIRTLLNCNGPPGIELSDFMKENMLFLFMFPENIIDIQHLLRKDFGKQMNKVFRNLKLKLNSSLPIREYREIVSDYLYYNCPYLSNNIFKKSKKFVYNVERYHYHKNKETVRGYYPDTLRIHKHMINIEERLNFIPDYFYHMMRKTPMRYYLNRVKF